MKKRRNFLWRSILFCFFLLPSYVYASTWDIFDVPKIYSQESLAGHLFPEVEVILQRPTYLIETGSWWYMCDTNKPECKVNFKLVTPEWKDVSSRYSCQWQSKFESEQFQRCNPNTVIFPEGTFNISVILTYNATGETQTALQIQIINNQQLEEVAEYTQPRSDPDDSVNEDESEEPQPEPRILEIQSWLDVWWNCSDERCKINLEYKKRSKEYCEWHFWWLEHLEKYTITCNPGFIYALPWNYRIGVKIYHEEDWFLEELSLNIYNTFIIPETPDPSHSGQSTSSQSDNNIEVENQAESRILWVQSWLDAWWNCFDERCKINLEYKKRSKEYCEWDFWWLEYLEKYITTCNPGFIYALPWNYRITVKIYHEEEWFSEELSLNIHNNFVPVIESVESISAQEESETTFSPQDFLWIQIYWALVNPQWRDTETEYIELVNISDETINLRGWVLDDMIGKWSKPYQIDEDIFLEPWAHHQFLKTQTSISLWNTLDEVNIVVWDTVIHTLSWDFQIPEEYVLKSWDTDALERYAEVIRVIDGDTIEVRFEDWQEKKLRFIWVDTPETKHPRKAVEKYGKEASAFTKKILEWKRILIQQSLSNYQDKYGRLLGYVYLEDMFFNAELIKQWFARAYTRYEFAYRDEFLALQKQAKKDKVGLWQEPEITKLIQQIEKQEKVEIIWEEVFSQEETIVVDTVLEIDSFLLDIPEEIITWVTHEEIGLETWVQGKVKKYVFQKTLSYQKKSFKISGKTEPYFTVIVEWWDKSYRIVADRDGKYSKKITDIIPGTYEMKFYLVNQQWQQQYIKSSEVDWTQEYVDNMHSYTLPKAQQNLSAQEEVVPLTSAVLWNSVEDEWWWDETSEFFSIPETPKTPLGVVLGYILFGFSFMGWVHVLVGRNEILL